MLMSLNLTCPHSRKIKKVIDGFTFLPNYKTHKPLKTIVLFIYNHTKLKNEIPVVVLWIREASIFFLSGWNSVRLHMQHLADSTWTFKTDFFLMQRTFSAPNLKKVHAPAVFVIVEIKHWPIRSQEGKMQKCKVNWARQQIMLLPIIYLLLLQDVRLRFESSN